MTTAQPKSSAENGALELLRAATRDLHDRIESVVPLLRDDLTLEDYEAYLISMRGYYAPLETALRAVPQLAEELPDLDRRWKLAWVDADLRALGWPEEHVGRLPGCAVPLLASTAAAWGVLYVVEGSTLGGQILTRHLRSQLGLTPDKGLRFLDSYGSEVGSRWRAFCQHLCANIQSERDRETAVEFARAAFHVLIEWLEQRTTVGGKLKPQDHGGERRSQQLRSGIDSVLERGAAARGAADARCYERRDLAS